MARNMDFCYKFSIIKSKLENEALLEQFTTKCNVLSNGVTILDNRNVSITIKLDPKTQLKQWDGLLYLTGNESIIFYRSKGQIFEIEIIDGRKGKFYATQPGHTVAIKGIGPLK